MKVPSSRLYYLAYGSLCLAIAAHAQESSPAVHPDRGTTNGAQMAAQPSQGTLQLVAPVALFPDALLAEILTAASYPSAIVEASKWVQQHSDLTGQPRELAVNSQPWDPSVKGLAQFPAVLDNMSQNVSWTAALGTAYANDPDEVLDAIQLLRHRAESAGTLKSTDEQTVTTEGEAIVIDPAVPDFMYVPAYDPWIVYGMPLTAYPGWTDAAGVLYDGPFVAYGVGLDEGAFPTFRWGWHDWSLDWRRHAVLHNHAASFSPASRDERPQVDEHAAMSTVRDHFEQSGRFSSDFSPYGPFEESRPAEEFAPRASFEEPHEGETHAGGMAQGGFHGGGFHGGEPPGGGGSRR